MSPGRQSLFDHFIRPKEHFRWNRKSYLLGRLEVDDQLGHVSLYGQVSGLGALQDLVHKDGGAVAHLAGVCPIR